MAVQRRGVIWLGRRLKIWAAGKRKLEMQEYRQVKIYRQVIEGNGARSVTKIIDRKGKGNRNNRVYLCLNNGCLSTMVH